MNTAHSLSVDAASQEAVQLPGSVPALELQGLALRHTAQSQWLLEAVNLALQPAEIGCLLGPSGCGKTTLLRAIAGLLPIEQGAICIEGQPVSGPNVWLAPERRQVGMVFQEHALFPHLNVRDNVAFGLRRWAASERSQRVQEMLELVGLQSMASRAVHELSGGQQQRVALARSLAPRPRLLLLDEPFSSLDASLREQLADDVRRLLKNTGTTALMVTHDQREAMALADRIAVLAQGRVQQWGAPLQLYHRPASRFVAGFLGEAHWLPLRWSPDGRTLHTELGDFEVPPHAENQPRSAQDELLLRPDDLVHDDASPLRLTVVDRVFRGAHFLCTLMLPSGRTVRCQLSSHHDHAVGTSIGVRPEIDHLVWFAAP